MKQVMFIVYLFIAITIGLSDDVVERIAQFFSLSNMDVQICINKTDVKVEDLMKMDELVDDSIRQSSIDIDKSSSVLKVGCLLACLFQKKEMMSSTHINQQKLKEFLNSKMSHTDYKMTTERDRIFETCINRIKSKIDECEVMLKFTLCVIVEAKNYIGL